MPLARRIVGPMLAALLCGGIAEAQATPGEGSAPTSVPSATGTGSPRTSSPQFPQSAAALDPRPSPAQRYQQRPGSVPPPPPPYWEQNQIFTWWPQPIAYVGPPSPPAIPPPPAAPALFVVSESVALIIQAVAMVLFACVMAYVFFGFLMLEFQRCYCPTPDPLEETEAATGACFSKVFSNRAPNQACACERILTA